jgi:hypothetical protein
MSKQAISIDDRGRELIRGAIDETMNQVVDAVSPLCPAGGSADRLFD